MGELNQEYGLVPNSYKHSVTQLSPAISKDLINLSTIEYSSDESYNKLLRTVSTHYLSEVVRLKDVKSQSVITGWW